MGDFSLTINTLYQPGDIIEIRGLHPPAPAYVGRYKFGPEIIAVLEEADRDMNYDLYLVLNPTQLSPLSFQPSQEGSKEADICYRRWFLLDGDPQREHKIATDDQYMAAYQTMVDAQAWLIGRGWKAENIILASSGNGVHLLVRCELPNDAAAKQLIHDTQRAVSVKFSTDATEIECFNDANRLVRAYGSVNRKGQETETRKYRRSGLVL